MRRALLAALLVFGLWALPEAFAQTGRFGLSYPAANSSFNGTEKILGGQNGSFVLYTPAQLSSGGGGGLGYTPVNKAGDSMTGPLSFAASTTGNPSFVCPPGAFPTSPSAGAFGCTSSGVFIQQGGVTQQFAFVNPHTTLTTSSNTLADGGDYLIATVSSALGENLPQVSTMTEGHCIRTRDADNNAATHNVTLTAHAGDTINFFGASGTSLVAATNNFVDDFCARNGAWRVYSLGG